AINYAPSGSVGFRSSPLPRMPPMAPVIRSWLLWLAGVLGASSGLAAQNGVIAGRVTESARALPLANVEVTVRDASGRAVAPGTTRATGSYQIGGIAPGRYGVLIKLIPYSPKQIENVEVRA